MAWLLMKLQQLIGAQRQGRVGPALVVAELHFVDTGGESFDNRADLAAQQVVVSDIPSDATTDSSSSSRMPFLNPVVQNNWSGQARPPRLAPPPAEQFGENRRRPETSPAVDRNTRALCRPRG